MLNSMTDTTDVDVVASDGRIGQVRGFYFDDRRWAIRYLVVDTGRWLSGRQVLISPYAVMPPTHDTQGLQVALSCEQVRRSPHIDTQRPVSRQQERELLSHYRYPEYWGGDGLWAASALPELRPGAPTTADSHPAPPRGRHTAEVHLRSSAQVTGYDIEASDGSIGHVQDWVYDDTNWAIRYLVVDTRHWWPGGRKVLIGMAWADRIDWATRKLHVKLTRAQVKASPAFEDIESIHRDYETRLHQNYGRSGYWV